MFTLAVVGLSASFLFGLSRVEASPRSAAMQPGKNYPKGSLDGAFKKCKRGKPSLQMRLQVQVPIRRFPRKPAGFLAEVPALNQPIRHELQIKSCKKQKRVTVQVLGRTEDNRKWRKITLKRNKLRRFKFDITFAAPDPAVNNSLPNSAGNSAKAFALKAFTPYRKGRNLSVAASLHYTYSAEQMASISPTPSTGATGS